PGYTGNLLTHTVDHWFDANAYVPTPIGTFGNVSRNSLVGPNSKNVDLSLFKTTNITETMNVQFRFEMFNVFNRANFGSPNNVVFSSATLINPSAGQITS